MKRLHCIVGLLLCWFLVACIHSEPEQPGPYVPVEVDKPKVIRAALVAMEHGQYLVQQERGSQVGRLRLLEISKAEQQIFSGINFRLELKIELEHREALAKATVSWQKWRTPNQYEVVSWELLE